MLLFAGVASCCCGCAGSLSCGLYRIFLRTVTTVVLAALLLGLLYAVGFLLMDLSAEQDSYGTAVEIVEHTFEDIE